MSEPSVKKEKSSAEALGGETMSEEDKKILAAFHSLKFTPKIESTEDLISFMKDYGDGTGGVKKKPSPLTLPTESLSSTYTTPSTPAATSASASATLPSPLVMPKAGTFHFPKLSSFYGEDNKGDATWETFKFEIQALLADNVFSEEQLLLGIRRAVKGNAGDIVRRLGTGANVHQVIQKLDSSFGNIETRESILRKFYSTQQKVNESVTCYSSRLEEIFNQAVNLNGLKKTDEDILKQVLYQGLRPEIRHLSAYKCEAVMDYDRFKIELRKIEADLSSEKEKTKCNAAVSFERKETSELTEVKELLKKMNDRIDNIEQKQDNGSTQNYRGFYRGPRHYRGNRYNSYRGRGSSYSRGNSNIRRPTGTNTMQPLCHNCNGRGHQARDCTSQRVCFNCNQAGHLARNCPKV
jgi:hypothetical protein